MQAAALMTLLLLSAITACGQKGALHLPQNTQSSEVAKQTSDVESVNKDQ